MVLSSDSFDDPWPLPEEVEQSQPDAEEPPEEEAPSPRNFCTVCGTIWDPSWTECPVCAEGAARSQVTSARWVFSPDRSLRSALALYFVLLFTSLVAMILGRLEVADGATRIIFTGVADAIIVLLWMRTSFKLVRPSLANTGKLMHYLVAALAGCITFLVATTFVELLTSFLPFEDITLGGIFAEGGYGLGVVLLAICVQPAIIEELAFRGIILEALRRSLGFKAAVVVSACMFMILHLNPLMFPHLFLLGLVLVWLRTWSGSLYPCMVLHFIHNLMCVLTEAGG